MHDNWIRLLHTCVSLAFVYLPESPPHYASLFTKIETARAEESNHVSLFYRLIAMFFNTGESGHTVSSTLFVNVTEIGDNRNAFLSLLVLTSVFTLSVRMIRH